MQTFSGPGKMGTRERGDVLSRERWVDFAQALKGETPSAEWVYDKNWLLKSIPKPGNRKSCFPTPGCSEDDMATAPELPPPGDVQSTSDRRQISQRLLIHAREELDKGHRLQAGEKAWGAVVQPFKAIAEERGWKHGSHDDVREVIRHVALEYNIAQDQVDTMADAYFIGHRNFYENHSGTEELEYLIDRVEEVAPVLDALTVESPRPFEIISNTQLRRLRRLTDNEDLQIGDTSAVGFSLKHALPDDSASGTPSESP